MSRRITKKAASPETIDVDTFKAWLQGVEDMQGADWCPNLEQWKKIRQKIEQLEAVEEVAAPVYPAHQPTFIPRGLPQQTIAGGSIQGGPPQVMFNPAPPPSSLDSKPSDANVAVDGTFQSSFA